MDKSLYIVESPFQLLGAVESIDYHKTENYGLVVRLSTKENTKQLRKMIEDLEVNISKIIFISAYGDNEVLKKIADFKFLIWLFLNKNKYTKYLLGDYHSRYFTLLRKLCLKNKKIIYLDDGASTIRANNSFSKNNFFDWFTIYDLVALPEQSIIHHDFPYLRHKIKQKVLDKSNKTIILGDKFYEAGLLSQKDSNKILEKLMDRLEGEDVTYMAHRGESVEKLEYIRKKYDIDVVKNDFPIELYGLYTEALPRRVVSFFSTALYSLQKIYPEIEVSLYRVDTTMFTSHVETYNDAYRVYEPYMEIIKLT
jgi:hypothetical protein